MSAYSKPTDAHAYLAPGSCTAPHLNLKRVYVAKTVGAKLINMHSSDFDLLNSLNLYSGYIIARGYQEKSIMFHLAAMANRDRIGMLSGQFKPKTRLTVPLVTDLHPAITCLSSMMSIVYFILHSLQVGSSSKHPDSSKFPPGILQEATQFDAPSLLF